VPRSSGCTASGRCSLRPAAHPGTIDPTQRRGHRVLQVQQPGPRCRRRPGQAPRRRGLWRFCRASRTSGRMIGFAVKRGYRRVILAGTRPAPNKVLHYAAAPAIAAWIGLVLPRAHLRHRGRDEAIRGRELRRRSRSRSGSRAGSRGARSRAPGLWSARRLPQPVQAGEAEDVFPTTGGRSLGRAPTVRCRSRPSSAADEYLDRRPAELIAAFERMRPGPARSPASILPGARHGFPGARTRSARPFSLYCESLFVGGVSSPSKSRPRLSPAAHRPTANRDPTDWPDPSNLP